MASFVPTFTSPVNSESIAVTSGGSLEEQDIASDFDSKY